MISEMKSIRRDVRDRKCETISRRSPYRDHLSTDSDSTRDHSHHRHLNPTRFPFTDISEKLTDVKLDDAGNDGIAADE